MSLTNNQDTTKLKLPNTFALVFKNGEFLPDLSDQEIKPFFAKKTLKVPKNTQLAKPVHILFLSSNDSETTLDIIADENSRINIIKEYVTLDTKHHQNTINVNCIAKKNSHIDCYRLETNDNPAYYNITTHVTQDENSKIISYHVTNSSHSSKNTIQVKLQGKEANYNIKAANLLHHNQSVSYDIKIEHLVPSCISNVLFKNIVDDTAISNFNCLAITHPGAIKTETHVTNKNLLLTETAIANTSPELEVYADDVICTHGATVGQLDQSALFYLCSRGIDQDVATKMLITAFIQEITNELPDYTKSRLGMDI